VFLLAQTIVETTGDTEQWPFVGFECFFLFFEFENATLDEPHAGQRALFQAHDTSEGEFVLSGAEVAVVFLGVRRKVLRVCSKVFRFSSKWCVYC
jgi:hypothetical protein